MLDTEPSYDICHRACRFEAILRLDFNENERTGFVAMRSVWREYISIYRARNMAYISFSRLLAEVSPALSWTDYDRLYRDNEAMIAFEVICLLY